MKIDDLAEGRELRHVGLGLAESEARELRDALEGLLAHPNPRHEHVSSVVCDRELTVWIVRD